MPRLKRKLHSRNLPSKQESEVPGALAESEPTPILLDDRNENLADLGHASCGSGSEAGDESVDEYRDENEEAVRFGKITDWAAPVQKNSGDSTGLRLASESGTLMRAYYVVGSLKLSLYYCCWCSLFHLCTSKCRG